jgi:hypothetical protein
MSGLLANIGGGDMRRKAIALAAAALIGLAAVASPSKVEARSSGWWIPGAIVGGLAIGAIMSGAYGPYYDEPCCYYYPRPYYYYYGPRYHYYRPYYYRPHRYYRYHPRYRYHRRHHHYRHHH